MLAAIGALILVFIGMLALYLVLRGAPYIPTLQRDLDKLFDELGVTSRDLVVDLGSGDGRVLKCAAQKGARAIGYELNPFLNLVARRRIRTVRDQAKVITKDFWKASLPEDTTIVFVFLAESFMDRLYKYLTSECQQLNHDIKLISFGFRFHNREPEKVVGGFNIYRFKP